MLPKINKLSKQKDFLAVFNKNKVNQDECLVIKFKPSDKPFSRFGLVVSSSVDKRATVRNRLRRQLKEIVRGQLKSVKAGFDIVLIAKPILIEKSFREIEKSLITLIKRANLRI